MGKKRLAIAAGVVILLAGVTVVLSLTSDEDATPPSRPPQVATDAPAGDREEVSPGRAQEAQLERERLARLAEFTKIPLASMEFDRVPDAPIGDPVELSNVYRTGDTVTLRRLEGVATLSYFETSVEDMKERRVRDLYGVTYSVTMKQRQGERVSTGGNTQLHEGRYDVLSYIWMREPVIRDTVQIGARFWTDRRGGLVPGRFQQTDGPPLAPLPEFIGERGFGILPERPVRPGSPGETWGTTALRNPFAKHITLDGEQLSWMPFVRSREGGWRINGGEVIKQPDGNWSRSAHYDLELHAVENGRLLKARFRGQAADISYFIQWKGRAIYMLRPQILVRVDDLAVITEVRVKTQTMLHRWRGSSSLNFEMYKDP